ncbi:MAG: response regulator [Chitinophagaceae bacterium]|nr:MAG: response regulator [Chitinophagaceae bacterium]
MNSTPSVLLVDDDIDLLEMVCLALETQQWKVTCINEANDVMPFLERTPPDLILMDVYLRNQDGREICKSIKGSALHHMIPIILYSAGNISVNSIKESSADLFISKPFDLNYLIEKIKFFLASTVRPL